MRFSSGNVFLSYVNKLCSYPKLRLSSSRFRLRLRTDKGSTNQYVLLIYCSPTLFLNETIYLLGNLPFFKIHVNCFMARDVPMLSQNACCE